MTFREVQPRAQDHMARIETSVCGTKVGDVIRGCYILSPNFVHVDPQ